MELTFKIMIMKLNLVFDDVEHSTLNWVGDFL